MLEAVDAVAGDLEWRGRIAAPSLRIARMTVAGG
jgi:predicted Zn-dependent protease